MPQCKDCLAKGGFYENLPVNIGFLDWARCGQPVVDAAPQYCPLVAREGRMKAASGSDDKLSYAWSRKSTNKDILGRLIGHRLMLVSFLITSSSV